MTESPDISKVREFWDARPCNLRHSNAEVGTKKYFNEVEAKKYFVEPHIPWFAQFEQWAGLKVLEIGCGIGTDTINFLRVGADVTAVDLSVRSLRMVHKRWKAFGPFSGRLTMLAENVEQLAEAFPYTYYYDLVYAFGVIHHTPHPQLALAQMRRFLKSDGTLKIMVYHRRSWKAFWILMRYGHGKFWKWRELIAQNSEAQTGCPVTYTYTKREITKMLEACGLRVVQLSVEHIFPYQIEPYKRHEYKKVWYFRWMPKWLFHWLEHRIGWHLCVTAVPVSKGQA